VQRPAPRRTFEHSSVSIAGYLRGGTSLPVTEPIPAARSGSASSRSAPILDGDPLRAEQPLDQRLACYKDQASHGQLASRTRGRVVQGRQSNG
jgi:hypothetical protein